MRKRSPWRLEGRQEMALDNDTRIIGYFAYVHTCVCGLRRRCLCNNRFEGLDATVYRICGAGCQQIQPELEALIHSIEPYTKSKFPLLTGIQGQEVKKHEPGHGL